MLNKVTPLKCTYSNYNKQYSYASLLSSRHISNEHNCLWDAFFRRKKLFWDNEVIF